MKYNSEEEFLKDYDSSQFEKLSMTTDIIIFSISDGIQKDYRKLKEKKFSVLLVKRNTYPFKDKWCLPGSFVGIEESIRDAAVRILADETNLHNIYLEQLYTFGAVDRDPRMRIVSTAYMALIDKNQLKEKVTEKACWFDITVDETKDRFDIRLESELDTINFVIAKELIQATSGIYNYRVIENDKIAFDHAGVIITGITRMKNKIEYTDIVFNLMPKYFTLKELQQVYEIVLGKKLLDPAFRRIIADKVRKTNKMQTGGGHRPSALFEYKGNINK